MPSGQLMTMPILIVNMGGEMVYILEQRLNAQKIPEAKGQKVLNDVIKTMYYPRFIEELFKPQEMYSIQSTRQIFDRLAHSSIMRLNESSMDKLFDLMAMGFKYQIISCLRPSEMIDVTLNHLEALKKLVAAHPGVSELLEECIRQMHVAYDSMPLAELNAMRQSLCAFYQDRKVKVSLFLHEQRQNHDGTIVVPGSGYLPAGATPIGTVRYYQGGQVVSQAQLPTCGSASWIPGSGARTALGANLYEKDRAEEAPPAAHAPPPGPPLPTPDSVKTAAAIGELNMLASLIGASQPPPSETFKLANLFSADVFDKSGGREAGIIQIDGSAPSDHRAGLDDIRGQFDGLGAPPLPAGGGDDDLLDLMDRA